jgi:hypothetical protein
MWIYEGAPLTEIPEGAYGFVYEITNNVSGRKYIGKKLFWFSKTRQVKKKKKKYKVESDWKEYYGSNVELLADIQTIGSERFTRQILRICNSKGECNYFEMREQMINDVLLRPAQYYNGFVGGKIGRSHLSKLIQSS